MRRPEDAPLLATPKGRRVAHTHTGVQSQPADTPRAMQFPRLSPMSQDRGDTLPVSGGAAKPLVMGREDGLGQRVITYSWKSVHNHPE